MSYSKVSAQMFVGSSELTRKHNITILGDGEETLVFGHGFGCDQEIWHHVTPAFLDNYRVVLFDYMGCGKSDLSSYNSARYNNLQAYADDLVFLCKTLELKEVYFVGHSVSGAIAMLASIHNPDLFRKIIAIGPSPRYLNEPPDYIGGFTAADIASMLDMMERNYFGWAEYLAPIVIGDQEDSSNINELKLSFLRADPFISKQFAIVTFYCDIRSQLKDIPVPVTILYCLEDVIVSVEVIDFLHISIPDCKVIKLDASGHYPQLINPNTVIRAVQKEIGFGT